MDDKNILIENETTMNINQKLEGLNISINMLDTALQSRENDILNLNSKQQKISESLESNFSQVHQEINTIKANLEKTIQTYDSTINELLIKAQKSEEKINSQLEKINQESKKIETDLTNANAQLPNLHTSINKIQTSIESSNQQVAKINNDLLLAKNTITSEISKINTEYKTKESEFQKSFNNWLEEQKTILSEKFNPIESNTHELINFLEEKKNEAINIVGIIADTGLVGKYKNEADIEKKSAILWRRIGFGLMSLPSFLVMYAMIEFAHNFDWKMALFRFVSGAAFTLPSVWALREASKNFEISNSCRNKELELVSLNPYLDKLPEDQKNEIKKALVPKYFGQNNEGTNNNQQLSFKFKLDKNIISAAVHRAISENNQHSMDDKK